MAGGRSNTFSTLYAAMRKVEGISPLWATPAGLRAGSAMDAAWLNSGLTRLYNIVCLGQRHTSGLSTFDPGRGTLRYTYSHQLHQ